MRKQYAVYWAPTGRDRYGSTTYGTPIELRCRWVDVMREVRRPEGSTFVCRAIVYPDQQLALKGFLRLGKLTDLASNTLLENTNVFEIQMLKNCPNLQNTETLYEAFL